MGSAYDSMVSGGVLMIETIDCGVTLLGLLDFNMYSYNGSSFECYLNLN